MSRRMQDMRRWVGEIIRKCPFDVAGLCVVAGYCLVMAVTGLPCPILYITGVSCAGCGMTRAWIALLQLDVQTAFSCHPLFWVPIVAVVLLLFRKRMPQKLYQGLWAVIIFLMLGVYLLRMFTETDTIVVFHPKEGLLWRTAAELRSLAGQWIPGIK